jgi:hypothetical protein
MGSLAPPPEVIAEIENAGGKYIAPHLRGGDRKGEKMGDPRDRRGILFISRYSLTFLTLGLLFR